MSTALYKTKTRGSTTSAKAKDEEKASSQLECDQVYDAIKRWKAHDGAVLLPVVRKNTVAALKDRAKPKWWKVKKTAKSTLCITTPQNLQREIESTAGDGQTHELFLLISRQVDLPELQFDVPASIDNLYIIRCGHGEKEMQQAPKGDGDDQAQAQAHVVDSSKKLILNGSSRFCGVRLDEWQSRRVGEHNVILGPGVVIQLQPLSNGAARIPWTARDALEGAVLGRQQREEVARHLRELCEARCEGSPQWETWRGPVNKMLDVAAGSTTAAQVVECYANGIVVQAATKVAECGLDGLLRVSAGLLCVAGPGKVALAGVGVAAAIYFVPWDTVWGWFRAAFGALLTWIMRAWENFKSWVAKEAAGKLVAAGKQGVELAVRPMLTAG